MKWNPTTRLTLAIKDQLFSAACFVSFVIFVSLASGRQRQPLPSFSFCESTIFPKSLEVNLRVHYPVLHLAFIFATDLTPIDGGCELLGALIEHLCEEYAVSTEMYQAQYWLYYQVLEVFSMPLTGYNFKKASTSEAQNEQAARDKPCAEQEMSEYDMHTINHCSVTPWHRHSPLRSMPQMDISQISFYRQSLTTQWIYMVAQWRIMYTSCSRSLRQSFFVVHILFQICLS